MKLSKIEAIHFYGDICLKYAALDLARDFFAVTGKKIDVIESDVIAKGILSIGTAREKEYAEKASLFNSSVPQKEEEYSVSVLSDRIVIFGADKRGAMWGVYALSEKMGVLPLHRFTDSRPEKKDEIAEEVFGDHPKTYRFRGWFINDEDLLTKRVISGGKRNIDYPYYGDVCDVRSLDEILETALRLGINMIIPGSLIDIDEPYQRALVERCVERGFYVTQHHVEPVGVSFWTKDKYFERKGEAPIKSYLAEKERMKEVWRHYIGLWSKYGENVIWQLGLRGKGDVPVWSNEEENLSSAEWGQIITEAIETQYDLISEKVGEKFHSTATLWMEGARMYTKGSLRLPEKTTVIFSDVGFTQMMSSDFYTTPRSSKRESGLYYHVAYWGAGPHLAPGNDPRKMLWNYEEAVRKGDTAYSILNVSNVREVLYNAFLNSRLIWDIEAFDQEEADKIFARDYFGNEELSFFYPEYFRCFMCGTMDDVPAVRRVQFDTVEKETPFPYYVVNDGDVRLIGWRTLRGFPVPGENWIERLEDSISKFENLKKCCEGYPHLPYFEETLFFIQYFTAIETWAKQVRLLSETGCEEHREKAAKALEDYIEKRKKLERAPFENWFAGEEKMDLSHLLRLTLTGIDDKYP